MGCRGKHLFGAARLANGALPGYVLAEGSVTGNPVTGNEAFQHCYHTTLVDVLRHAVTMRLASRGPAGSGD